MSLHRCTEAECPFVGQTTTRSCRCHKTDEQVLRESRATVITATQALVADIEEHHSPDDCSTCRAVDTALDAISNAERKTKS